MAETPEQTALIKGMRHGMDVAISMARVGNLRLAALPFEKGEYPRDNKIRPLKATVLVWKAWWKELRAKP